MRVFTVSIILFSLLHYTVVAQQSFLLRGIIKDSLHLYGVAGVAIEVWQSDKRIGTDLTDDAGTFKFNLRSAPPYELRIKSGFRIERKVAISNIDQPIEILIGANEVKGEEVVITAYRPTFLQPVTQSTLHQKAIKEQYYGADVPTMLQSTPAVQSYSDAGNGIGYSYFRLRGIDQTRINFSVNGIPVNDPENQGFFFNNFADLLSSAKTLQVVRGVGTSTNGTSAFGGALHLETLPPDEQAGFGFSSGLGSFNSSRFVVDYNSGKLNDKHAFCGRFSQLQSGGYRNHSGTSIQSYYVSSARYGKRSTLRFNAFGGSSSSQLAYAGITREDLNRDRRFNPISNGEKDAFNQHFFQLQYDLHLSEKIDLAVSPYHVRGNAPKFQFTFPALWQTPFSYFNMPNLVRNGDTVSTAGDMMVSYRLRQELYGAFAHLRMHKGKSENIFGVHANTFASDHFMETVWGEFLPQGIGPGHEVYFNKGVKNEISIFNKATHYINDKWLLFGDIQWRLAQFNYSERIMEHRPSFGNVEPMQWSFFNPKAGVRFFAANNLSLYTTLGVTSREPTRFDYFQDDFATRENIRRDDIKPEQVTNLETGVQFGNNQLRLNANLFYMQFNNQILGSGVLNQFGTPINTNVEQSFRRGAEFECSYRPAPKWLLTHHSTWMQSRIKRFTAFYFDDAFQEVPVEYNNVAALLTPAVIAQQTIRYYPLRGAWIEVGGRYVSRQYLDNTQSVALSIPEYFVTDARLQVQLHEYLQLPGLSFSLVCNNVLNTRYIPWGSVAPFSNFIDFLGNTSAEALFFPAVTRNWFATLSWRF
jgi:iron complex outermembrane receptor protein